MHVHCVSTQDSVAHAWKIFILYILAGFNNKSSLKQVAFWGS